MISKGRSLYILIFGDQQVAGLASKLQTARAGKWNDVYKVFGEVKPNASSSAILESLEKKSQSISSDSIIIIAVGSNEKNPYELFASLCIVLSKLKDKKVYLLNVQQNIFLSTKLLNSEIKMIAKNFVSCKYIETNTNMYHGYYCLNSLEYLCFKLNIEIDYLKYERQCLHNGIVSKIVTNRPEQKNCNKNNVPAEEFFRLHKYRK